jgi:hypothetical protein
VKVAAVRTRYDHISHSWRRATDERRAALIGELELLSLQLPAAATNDPDGDDIVALRADIVELITAVTIGLSDAD